MPKGLYWNCTSKVVVHPDGVVAVHHVLPFEEQPVVADQKKSNPWLNFMSCA
jgi:hypothetical protein